MAEYATVPEPWMAHPERVREWMGRALEWVSAMPPKTKTAKAPRKR